MLLGKAKSIESLVTTELQRGPIDTALLIANIKKKRPNTTKQGVYAALRNLRKEEIVVLHNKKTSFNLLWLKQMDEFLAVTERHYVETNFGRDNFLNLKEGERIVYFFGNPAETDKFWGHALVTLAEASTAEDGPAYLYNPHEWFLIARKESERECIAFITKKRRFLLTAGNKLPLDRVITKEFDGNHSQYHMHSQQLFAKNNYYLNIVGDFLIEVLIDEKIAAKIEVLYQNAEKLDDRVLGELNKIIGNKERSRLTISRNSKKASRLKKILGKNFYIPVKQADGH